MEKCKNIFNYSIGFSGSKIFFLYIWSNRIFYIIFTWILVYFHTYSILNNIINKKL